MHKFAIIFPLLIIIFNATLSHAENTATPPKPLPGADEIVALPPDGGTEFNRLIFEKSPYLLQHARNPVDWYPWGDDAFLKAEAEDKLIFLSIGYATCHWCHVMEVESFADPEVANIMNENYVCVKVDREERPDVDDYFMKASMALTQQGGWPNNLFLTPDRVPIFAATYIPKTETSGRPGMLQVLPAIAKNWVTQKEGIKERVKAVAEALKEVNTVSAGDFPKRTVMETAYNALKNSYDKEYGGFGAAPKFPTPHNFGFLLRYWKSEERNEALGMVVNSLTEMRMGGIYDHIGYGFHRYATDKQWLIPHFEKMLYDQALIAIAYLETFQATDNTLFSQTAHEIFTYVLRDMTDVEGAFYSSEDADTNGIEGDFYLWTAQEVRNVLGSEEAEWCNAMLGVREEGNWTIVQDRKKNILHLRTLMEATKKEDKITLVSYGLKFDKVREKLFQAREKRGKPFKNKAVLCDWNGLMIAALAKGGATLSTPKYADAARKAADYVLENMRDKDGGLMHRSMHGDVAVPGMIDDYAFFVWGLIELYEATFETRFLESAVQLTNVMLSKFSNENGGFYMTAEGASDLPVRPIASYDGALPSGNSIAMLNLLRLGRMTADINFENAANGIPKAFSVYLNSSPQTQTQLLQALDFSFGPAYELVVVGENTPEEAAPILSELARSFTPNKVVLLKPLSDDSITRLAPFTLGMENLDGKATAYVCRDFACELPTTDTAKMLELLGVSVAEDSQANYEKSAPAE